jgi:predicted small secreted protein
MSGNIKQIFMAISLCAFGSFVLTSCHTVKGAFQGAGKDVATLVQPEGSHHKTVYKKAESKTTVSKTTTTKTQSVQPAAASQSSPAPQSTSTTQSTTGTGY